MAPRKNTSSTAAELSLVQLQKCFVNLPSSLVNALMNIDTPVQNVVIELNYTAAPPAPASGGGSATGTKRSVFVGWTGMPSRRKAAPPALSRTSSRETEVPLVEMDATFAATLGLRDGQRVTATVHLDPPLAHTIHIEPLTPDDWEMVELHATFLEINLMNQIRAVPNPAAAPGGAAATHPLTLHLSPTSTANVRVLSIEPALGPDAPFAKVAPDAEVIVAPKTRPKAVRPGRETRSVASTSRRSGTSGGRGRGGGSGAAREERRPALFLRAVDRDLCDDWFEPEDNNTQETDGLAVWVDADLLRTGDFKGVQYASVALLQPAAAPAAPSPDAGATPGPPEAATRVVVQLRPWDDPPNGQTAALSGALCAALGSAGIVGGVVKLEPAVAAAAPKLVSKVRLVPFGDGNTRTAAAAPLKLGGEAQHEKDEAVQRIRTLLGGQVAHGVLQGPLTDGLVLGVPEGAEEAAAAAGWGGGIVKLGFVGGAETGPEAPARWVLGAALGGTPWELAAVAPRPVWLREAQTAAETAAVVPRTLVGVTSVLETVVGQLRQGASVLLTGSLGAGKTTVARQVGETLRRQGFFSVAYVGCRQVANAESRIGAIKERLARVFAGAAWGARLGGRAVVILDDLERLCAAETELVVQSEEGRSRQLSEGVCALVRQYGGRGSGVVVLATAQGKDELHPVVVGGHVVREMVELRAPDKEARRALLEGGVGTRGARGARGGTETDGRSGGSRPTTAGCRGTARHDDDSHDNSYDDSYDDSSRPTTANGRPDSADGWMMDGPGGRDGGGGGDSGGGGFVVQADLDFLDVAGATDGFMPGDLEQLVARAKNEALVRASGGDQDDHDGDGDGDDTGAIALGRIDFVRARRGFTPTSLRNVALQAATTTFASIGGLGATRQVLLETLAYPTRYAPIFAQCPLRLRSGLLLYGHPGCGKTLLAGAVAGECGLNFISVKGPEILNKYIGASEKSVRDLFARASAAKPCVLFFDEFDAIAPKRGHDATGVTDRVVNQLLTQMDGAEGLDGVYVLAATSRPDLIDPALLRPGRLDKSLLCGMPAPADRVHIFAALARKARVADGLLALDRDPARADLLARRTDGFSGADLQALVSNAQLEAIHDALGVAETTDRTDRSKTSKTSTTAKTAKAAKTPPKHPLTFCYGDDLVASRAERAALAARLDVLRRARRRERSARHGTANGPVDAAGPDDADMPHVVIAWPHVLRALDVTRPSISVAERRRLERIYHEFVVGRSGDMRDGQGSMAIGERSSLM